MCTSKQLTSNYNKYGPQHNKIDMIQYYRLMLAQKLAEVSLVYCTEPKTKTNTHKNY